MPKTRPTTNEQKPQNKNPGWNTIMGEATIFGNTFDSPKGGKFTKFSIGISKKISDTEYENIYLPVRFRKDDEPDTDGKIKIMIFNAFLTIDSYTKKSGEEVKQLCLFIDKYEYASN